MEYTTISLSLSLPLLTDPKLPRQLQPHGKPKSTARTQRSLPAQPSTRSLVSASRSPGLAKSSKRKPPPNTDSVVRSPPHQTEQPCSTLISVSRLFLIWILAVARGANIMPAFRIEHNAGIIWHNFAPRLMRMRSFYVTRKNG